MLNSEEKNENEFDSSKEKDEFERIRYEIRHKMNQVETFLQTRANLQDEKDAKKILERNNLQTKIDNELQAIKKNLDQLSTVFESQKKNKKKYPDVENKGNILSGLRQGYDLLKCQNDGTEPVNEKNSKNTASQLEELIGRSGNATSNINKPPDREIYQEEQDKIDEWGNKIKQQDQVVVDVIKDIKTLGAHAKKIGELEDELGVKIGQTSKMAAKTDVKLTETRKKLADLLEKYKSADRFCIDLVLICICLGLVAVLYNVIKSKYFSGSTTTTSSTTNSTSHLFLYY